MLQAPPRRCRGGASETFALFREAYRVARQAQPLLPPLGGDHEVRLRLRVERAFMRAGVVA